MDADLESAWEVDYRMNAESGLLDANESATDCAHSELPSVKQYYSDLHPLLACVIALSTAAVLATWVVYVRSLRHVFNRTPSSRRGPTMYVLSIYPAASLAAYVSVMIPRAFFLVEVIVQDLYTLCVYQMFCLLVVYCEDDASSSRLRGALVHLSTGPCCCLPCCRQFCRPVPLSRNTLLKLRILVLQLPIFLWLLYGASYVLWAEDEKLLDSVYTYLGPMQLVSVLLAGWGTNMVAKVLSEALDNVQATQKFLALELTVLFPEVQSILANYVASLFSCSLPLTPIFWSNLVVNVLTLLELVVLSLWAHSLYCHEEIGFGPMEEEEEEEEHPYQLIFADLEACESSSSA